jgi:hypothetical protein
MSAPVSTVGSIQITMANYVESLYYTFLELRLIEDFGRTNAVDWMPKFYPTDSIVQSLNGNFSWHSDSKEMLVDESDLKKQLLDDVSTYVHHLLLS